MVTKVLCVAEKPSIAKAVANILGGQQVNSRTTRNTYTRNYDCSFTFPVWGSCDVTVTSVAGHLFSTDFTERHAKWHSCAPSELFDAKIVTTTSDNMKDVHDNIVSEARRAQILMIWTDCDREGEYIGWEVMTAAQKSNRNIEVKRANFNNLEKAYETSQDALRCAYCHRHIIQAARNPVNLDMQQVNAVAARIELDLRTGAAFTRLQTMQLRDLVPALSDKLISYGSCQYPTLGFVVDRWKKVSSFRPEPYWGLKIGVERDGINVAFKWKRGVLYDRLAVIVLYSLVLEAKQARITSVQQKPKSRWRPLPLTTVELQKQGTKYLRMSSNQIMDHAEKLYQKGFVSYPRTETDQFDRGMDLQALIRKQFSDQAWGDYARGLIEGAPPTNQPGFRQPRNGRNNDKAHPPIHPVAHVTASACASAAEHQVYTFITRRFLACCSEDAKGQQSDVDLAMGGERFSAHGLMVTERNYLEVYPYDRWESSAQLPTFTQGELVVPKECKMTDGFTSPPTYLTEPELIGLMDANGIGTDATMASHIETILNREYCIKQAAGRVSQFVPSTLGIALCEGFDAMGFDESLTKPHLRKETERKLALVSSGSASKREVIEEFVEEYKGAFMTVQRQIGVLKAAVLREMT